MLAEKINYEGNYYVRVSKIKAKKEFEKNQIVLVLPVNVRYENMWISVCEIKKTEENSDFDKRLGNYCYYNCSNPETGYYPKYYIKEEIK
jgi:hypothetical protein